VGLNRPLFLVALAALLLAILGELGLGIFVVHGAAEPPDPQAISMSAADAQRAQQAAATTPATQTLSRPGVGIPSLALLDALLLLLVILAGLALILPGGLHGRIQGIVSFVASLLLIIADVIFLFATLALLFTMIGLVLAAPFGTLAYLAIWGSFARSAAAATLGILLAFKLAFGVCLALAHPRFLENKWLVLLALTSLFANVLLSFLHGFPPRVLASITDAAGGLAIGILAILWALFFFVGSILAIIKVLRPPRAPALVTSG
jgi:hypothetical protein